MNKLLLIFLSLILLFSCTEQNNSDRDQVTDKKGNEILSESLADTIKKNITPKTVLNYRSVETFHLSTKRDTIIKGKKGVLIYIPGNSFDIDKSTTNISIQLEEYLSLADMFLADLSTTSKGLVLESNGMVNIKALAGNNEIGLKPNSNIIIHFPKNNDVKQMDLLRGVSTKKGVYWQKDTTNQIYLNLNGMSYFWQNIPPLEDTIKLGLIDFLKPKLRFTFNSFDEKTKKLCNNKSITFDFKINHNGKAETIKINKSPYENLKIKSMIDYQAMNISEDFDNKMLSIFSENLPLMKPSAKDIPTQLSVKPEYIEIPRYVNDKGYNNSFAKAASKNKSFNRNNLDNDYTIFYSSKPGWINCGRYPDTKTPRTDFAVTVDGKFKTEVKIVVKDFKGISEYSSFRDDKFYFENIPSKLTVKIVVIQYRDDQIYYAIKESNTSNHTESKFDFKVFTLAELKRDLEKLN